MVVQEALAVPELELAASVSAAPLAVPQLELVQVVSAIAGAGAGGRVGGTGAAGGGGSGFFKNSETKRDGVVVPSSRK